MSDEPNYEYRWTNKEYTAEELFQLLIDRIALLENRVQQLEERVGTVSS